MVVYDDNVDAIIPLHEVTDGFVWRQEQIGVHTGGMTFLSGGWLRGCEEIAANSSSLPLIAHCSLQMGCNVGITNLEELTTHAREIFRRGISTTCFELVETSTNTCWKQCPLLAVVTFIISKQ